MILFVGDRPSKLMKVGDPPFVGARCERRLQRWFDKLGATYYCVVNSVDPEDIVTINLWIALEAPIVALGNSASKALGQNQHFKLPHPSGRNRQINDKEFIETRLLQCKEYIAKVLKENADKVV